jgi:AraC-like DNA-binding protein
LAGPEARLIATHVHDLAALVIGAANDAWQFANGRGGRAALLWALKTDIAAHASDPALSVGAVAARHGISARYVHKLFEPTGVTFSEFVLARRLANAHAALVDRRFDDRSITSIALRVGFGDLSYFNRTFRRRFGKTPSDVRKNREGSE